MTEQLPVWLPLQLNNYDDFNGFNKKSCGSEEKTKNEKKKA